MESARDLEADSGVENMMLSLIHLTSVPGRVDIMSQVPTLAKFSHLVSG
jgi:hypothetical protein